MDSRQKLKTIPLIKMLASVRLTVVCLCLLFILTFWGTIAQVYNGLYLAQERYFHSFVFFVFGFLPFPGGQLVMMVMFVNLLCVAVTRFVFQWRHVGILIIHGGLLLFFVAGFVTLRGAQESYLNLHEGHAANVTTAYHDWEVSLWEVNKPAQDGQIVREVIAFNADHLKSGMVFAFDNAGIQMTVKEYYRNSVAYQAVPDEKPKYLNASGIGHLQSADLSIEPEKNMPGGIFHVAIKDGTQLDLLLFGGEAKPLSIKAGGKDYNVILRLKRFPLPFVLKLEDFMMERHPGTDTARSYKSQVAIRLGDAWREKLISMNNPLRYKDYTLYQASYSIDAAGREASTLAVVKNKGRLLPYISTFVIFIGLVVHFVTMALASRKSREIAR